MVRPSTPRITPASLRRLFARMVRLACWVAGAIGIACGTYLTLKKSSMLQEVWWLPGGVARWADEYGRFRNFPAYAVLALPFMIAANGRRARFNAFRWLALFGAVVEALQYFIPTRWCEWQDVAWSWAGLLATWIVVELGYKAAWEIRCAIVRKPDPERTAQLVDAVLTRVPPTRRRS
jgi:hypothetical protein